MSSATGIRSRIRNLPPSLAFWCILVGAIFVGFGFAQGQIVWRVILLVIAAGWFVAFAALYTGNRHFDSTYQTADPSSPGPVNVGGGDSGGGGGDAGGGDGGGGGGT